MFYSIFISDFGLILNVFFSLTSSRVTWGHSRSFGVKKKTTFFKISKSLRWVSFTINFFTINFFTMNFFHNQLKFSTIHLNSIISKIEFIQWFWSHGVLFCVIVYSSVESFRYNHKCLKLFWPYVYFLCDIFLIFWMLGMTESDFVICWDTLLLQGKSKGNWKSWDLEHDKICSISQGVESRC